MEDFIEFLKRSVRVSDVKFDIRANGSFESKIYEYGTSNFTGFSLYQLGRNKRVDYHGTSTGYSLEPFGSDTYKIIKGGLTTGYELRDNGWGEWQLYYGGALYHQYDYQKEKEEKQKKTEEDNNRRSYPSSSYNDSDSATGYWFGFLIALTIFPPFGMLYIIWKKWYEEETRPSFWVALSIAFLILGGITLLYFKNISNMKFSTVRDSYPVILLMGVSAVFQVISFITWVVTKFVNKVNTAFAIIVTILAVAAFGASLYMIFAYLLPYLDSWIRSLFG